MDEMMVVRNTSAIPQMIGMWLILPGQTELLPINLRSSLPLDLVVQDTVVADVPALMIFRNRCKEGCGHSLCILTRKLTAELGRRGYSVARREWRHFDQQHLGQSLLCNAGTFAGPNGEWAWLHFDNSIAPRAHVDYLLQHWAGSICPSHAVRDALIASGVPAERLRVVANAIDIEVYRPDGPVMDVAGDRFLFCMVGAMSPRKGVDVALEAYGQAFAITDHTTLLIKNYDYGQDQWCRTLIAEWQNRVGSTAPEVQYIYQRGVGNDDPPWSDEQVATLYRRTAKRGAYLAPARVEGFGLTGLEALACGCRLGTTGWSGQLEYATAENSTLFGYDLRPSQNNLALYEADEKPMWAEPRVQEVVAWMRRVFEEPADSIWQRDIAEDLRGRFSYERQARGIADVLGLKGRPESADRESVRPGTPLSKSIGMATAGPPGMETLGIGIPTRDRPQYLLMLLNALYTQTRRPDAICIVDDSHPLLMTRDEGGLKEMINRWRDSGMKIEIIQGPRKGQAFSHQIAADRLGTDLVLRIDDDLIPAGPDFVDRLYRLINWQAEVGAAAGTYPQHNDGRLLSYGAIAGRPGMTNGLDDLLGGHSHLQFGHYSDEHIVECEHLYSSWMYRRVYLMDAGGFPTCYSRMCFREETDASARLFFAGYRLLVDTGALAWHHLARGGQRGEVTRERVVQDDATFRQRLAEWRMLA